MSGCPDCDKLKSSLESRSDYVVIDIGESVKGLKEFLRLRDTLSVFDAVKAAGAIGIPCFVLEDGAVTFEPEDVGLESDCGFGEGQACARDGSGC